MILDTRIYEQFDARAPFKLENAAVLLAAQVGSHSHNTYIPKDDPQAVDDTDYMFIIVPPIEYTLGMRTWDNLSFIHEELDCVFYSFRKFMGMMAKGNPNILALPYLNPKNILHTDSAWDIFLENKNVFLNKKLTGASFIGYAKDQLKKMTHFDLALQKEWEDAVELITAAGWTVEDIIKSRSIGMPDLNGVFKVLLARGVASSDLHPAFIHTQLTTASGLIKTIHARHFQGYMGEKRKNLVRKYGYDTKNVAHLIRLMRMYCEYVQTGEFVVYRTHDAEELKDIKQGKWTLEKVQTEADNLFEKSRALEAISKLPELPDEDGINRVCVRILMRVYALTHYPQ